MESLRYCSDLAKAWGVVALEVLPGCSFHNRKDILLVGSDDPSFQLPHVVGAMWCFNCPYKVGMEAAPPKLKL